MMIIDNGYDIDDDDKVAVSQRPGRSSDIWDDSWRGASGLGEKTTIEMD